MRLFKNKVQLYAEQILSNYDRIPQKNLFPEGKATNYQQFINEIFNKIKKIANPILVLKFAALIHKIILAKDFKSFDRLEFYLNNNIEFSKNIQRIIQKQTFVGQQYWDFITIKQTFLPYLQYLQTRLLKNNELKEPEDYTNPQNLLQNIFEYINLIHKGSMFIRKIQLFARYYKQKYKFLLDINLLLAQDLKRIYHKLNRHFYKIWKKQNYTQLSTQKLQIIVSLNDEIDNLKQKLNKVFNNIYYSDEINKYMPCWIKIDSSIINQVKQLIRLKLIKQKPIPPFNNPQQSIQKQKQNKDQKDQSTNLYSQSNIGFKQIKVTVNDFVLESDIRVCFQQKRQSNINFEKIEKSINQQICKKNDKQLK